MKFNKPPFSLEQQLDLLIQRGMHCTDRTEALHYLGHINYYRLGAYLPTYGLTGTHCVHIIRRNTPAMPLNDAHSGGFFTSGACR